MRIDIIFSLVTWNLLKFWSVGSSSQNIIEGQSLHQAFVKVDSSTSFQTLATAYMAFLTLKKFYIPADSSKNTIHKMVLFKEHKIPWSQGCNTDVTLGGKQMSKILIFTKPSAGNTQQLSKNNKILVFFQYNLPAMISSYWCKVVIEPVRKHCTGYPSFLACIIIHR